MLDFIMTYVEKSYYSSVCITILHTDMPSLVIVTVLRSLKERKGEG